MLFSLPGVGKDKEKNGTRKLARLLEHHGHEETRASVIFLKSLAARMFVTCGKVCFNLMDVVYAVELDVLQRKAHLRANTLHQVNLESPFFSRQHPRGVSPIASGRHIQGKSAGVSV